MVVVVGSGDGGAVVMVMTDSGYGGKAMWQCDDVLIVVGL